MGIIEPRLLKGFRDYDNEQQLARQYLFSKIMRVFESHSFLPLSTPVLEYKEILMGKYGDDEKLVYTFKDMGDRDVAMRYDLTVPMARYVAQNQGRLTFPFKRYQIALAWRGDNTQRGRLREFNQCDVDIVGSNSLLADADAIACVCQAYEEIGVTNFVLRINDRHMFDIFKLLVNDEESLRGIVRSLDKVDKIGIDGVVNDLMSKGFKEGVLGLAKKYLSAGKGLEVLKNMPKEFGEVLSEPVNSLLKIFEYLQAMGVDLNKVLFDPSIARGQDYYTGVIFEWYLQDNLGFGSIGSGGRYDGLLDQFSKQGLSAVGASIGVDRLFEYLEDNNLLPQVLNNRVLIINNDVQDIDLYLQLATELRKNNIPVEVFYDQSKFDKQFKYADHKKFNFAIIIGEDEKKSNTVTIKTLSTREQVTIPRGDLVKYFISL